LTLTVKEAIALLKLNISLYEGDIFHELPIFLYFYNFINQYCQEAISVIFITCDLLTGIFLSLSTYFQLNQIKKLESQRVVKLKSKDKKKLEINQTNIADLSFRVFAIYLLSPYTILSCSAKATSVFSNLIISSILLAISLNYMIISCFLVALSAYQSLYTIMLLFPLMQVFQINNFK